MGNDMQHDALLPTPALGIDTKVPGPDDRDDGLLIEAAQQNPAAIGPIYQRYVTRVYRYLYSRVGNAPDAEDLTSQVFLEALQSLSRYRHRGNFAAWWLLGTWSTRIPDLARWRITAALRRSQDTLRLRTRCWPTARPLMLATRPRLARAEMPALPPTSVAWPGRRVYIATSARMKRSSRPI
jgi:Sigma-70 region 2